MKSLKTKSDLSFVYFGVMHSVNGKTFIETTQKPSKQFYDLKYLVGTRKEIFKSSKIKDSK